MNVQKTSDMQWVVRCKECRWLYIKDFSCGICNNTEGKLSIVKPNDYCSRGERRE